MKTFYRWIWLSGAIFIWAGMLALLTQNVRHIIGYIPLNVVTVLIGLIPLLIALPLAVSTKYQEKPWMPALLIVSSILYATTAGLTRLLPIAYSNIAWIVAAVVSILWGLMLAVASPENKDNVFRYPLGSNLAVNILTMACVVTLIIWIV